MYGTLLGISNLSNFQSSLSSHHPQFFPQPERLECGVAVGQNPKVKYTLTALTGPDKAEGRQCKQINHAVT